MDIATREGDLGERLSVFNLACGQSFSVSTSNYLLMRNLHANGVTVDRRVREQ